MTFTADTATQVELRVTELLATREGRAHTAEHLARLEVNQYTVGDYVDRMLPKVAPQWDGHPEERNRLFEALKDAVRAGISVFIDDAVAALLNGQPPALPGVELPACETDVDDATASSAHPRLVIEADPEEPSR